MRLSDILTRNELKQLSAPRNTPPLLNVALRVLTHTALILVAVEAWQANQHALFAVMFLINAALLQFLGYAGLSHELFHGKVFTNKALNKRLFLFTSYVLWNNPSFFEKSHGYHHANTFADDDDEAHSFQPFKPVDWIFYSTIDLRMLWRRVLYVLLNSAGKTISLPAFEVKSLGNGSDASAAHARRILVLQAALLVGAITWAGPIAGTILWLSPFAATAPNRLLAASQHIGLDSFKEDGPLAHSRTLILPRWLSELYAGMNYHCEHHLFPGIPFYNLPLLHELLVGKGLLKKEDDLRFFLGEFWVLQQKRDLRHAG